MVTVAAAAGTEVVDETIELFTVPKLQTTVPPLTPPQVPELEVAELNVVFGPRVSVNTTPDTGSPVL
jgi:hypothetical protein